MAARAERKVVSRRERLLYALMVRQFECSSRFLNDAYERLGTSLAHLAEDHLELGLLHWLEAELASPAVVADTASQLAPQLMRTAVALSCTLKP